MKLQDRPSQDYISTRTDQQAGEKPWFRTIYSDPLPVHKMTCVERDQNPADNSAFWDIILRCGEDALFFSVLRSSKRQIEILAADYWGILDVFRFAMMEELERYIDLVLLRP